MNKYLIFTFSILISFSSVSYSNEETKKDKPFEIINSNDSNESPRILYAGDACEAWK